MLGVLLAACSLGLAAAQPVLSCGVNPDGSCAAPEVSKCIGQCSRRLLNTSCLSVPGCTWNESQVTARCSPADPTVDAMCANQTRSADCGALSGCYWDTKQCTTTQTCASVNGTTTPDPCAGAANCGATPQCQAEQTCSPPSCSDHHKNESGCASLAGCFWSASIVTYSNGTGMDSGVCSGCLLDPETSYFLLSRDQLRGKACTNLAFNITTIVYRVTPAATGCSGGNPFPMSQLGAVCTDASSSAAGLTGTTSLLSVVVISFVAFLNIN